MPGRAVAKELLCPAQHPPGRMSTPRRPTMCPVMPCLSMDAFQADVIFASWLQRGDKPSAGQVRQAVAVAIRAFGSSGCAERVAQEFGDHPETAVIRMT